MSLSRKFQVARGKIRHEQEWEESGKGGRRDGYRVAHIIISTPNARKL